MSLHGYIPRGSSHFQCANRGDGLLVDRSYEYPVRPVFPRNMAMFETAVAFRLSNYSGEVAEWSKAHAWKVCRRETVSRVRIPVSPPYLLV